MSVVARHGEKVSPRGGTQFAELVHHYLGMPPTEAEKARKWGDAKRRKLRIRRVLALVGQALCELTFDELASVLSLKQKGTAKRLARSGMLGLQAAAADLGLEPGDIFSPRRQGTALDREPAAAEEEQRRPSGSRRSDRMRSLQRAGDAR